MSKFIKLTLLDFPVGSDGQVTNTVESPLVVNADYIVDIGMEFEHNCTAIYLMPENQCDLVKETPDEILKIINSTSSVK